MMLRLACRIKSRGLKYAPARMTAAGNARSSMVFGFLKMLKNRGLKMPPFKGNATKIQNTLELSRKT